MPLPPTPTPFASHERLPLLLPLTISNERRFQHDHINISPDRSSVEGQTERP